jgi:hypothetical protein
MICKEHHVPYYFHCHSGGFFSPYSHVQKQKFEKNESITVVLAPVSEIAGHTMHDNLYSRWRLHAVHI